MVFAKCEKYYPRSYLQMALIRLIYQFLSSSSLFAVLSTILIQITLGYYHQTEEARSLQLTKQQKLCLYEKNTLLLYEACPNRHLTQYSWLTQKLYTNYLVNKLNFVYNYATINTICNIKSDVRKRKIKSKTISV